MSDAAQDHADAIREALSVLYGNGSYRFMHESDQARKKANSALDSLVVENQHQAIELEGLRNEYGARVEERDRAEAKNRRHAIAAGSQPHPEGSGHGASDEPDAEAHEHRRLNLPLGADRQGARK